MEILNDSLKQHLVNNQDFRLELGCGPNSNLLTDKTYTVDIGRFPGVDIVADLNHPLELIPDSIVSHVYSRHTLEHVSNLTGLMEELHRVLTKNGKIRIIVPHFSNTYGYWDPTHVRQFGVGSMYYFCKTENQPKRKVPCFYSTASFKISQISLRFYKDDWLDKLLAPLLEKLVNKNYSFQVFYERHLSYLFPAWEIEFLMQNDKS